MNLYFLVEGETERKVYPRWLAYFLPTLTRVANPDAVTNNSYYLISGGGFPQLLDVHLPNAVADIQTVGKYDYLVVVLDADEVSVKERETEVHNKLPATHLALGTCQLYVIVQNKCIETWFLGNSRIYTRNPVTPELQACTQFYNVSVDDPELMDKPAKFAGTCANYHYHYLHWMLTERNVHYTKTRPRDVVEPHYIQQLEQRLQRTPQHLASLQGFI